MESLSTYPSYALNIRSRNPAEVKAFEDFSPNLKGTTSSPASKLTKITPCVPWKSAAYITKGKVLVPKQ